MSPQRPSAFEHSPQGPVRLAGVLYLAIILLGLFGEAYVRGTLVVAGDAAATAGNIARSPLLWRAGIAGDLLMHVLDIPVIWILYRLLKPVSAPLALLATLFNLIQTAVLVLNKLTLLLPLFLLDPDAAAYLGAFSTPQLQALSQLAIKTHGYGFGLGLVFFGCACLIRGHLIVRSGFLPPVLGWLLQIAGLGYLLNSFALLLAPAFAAAIFPAVLMPAFVGELALSLWLLIKGIKQPRWAAQRASAANAR